MKIPAMFAAEFRRLTSTRMRVIALIALVLVPVLYGGLYLWANQDPYGNLSEVPVALVVQDDGAELNGDTRNLGDEVASDLVEDGTFDWHEVDAAAAERGLGDGAFDFAVTLPADFTASVASIATADPHQAAIDLTTNDANNYLASTIGAQTVERIRSTITEKVVREAGLTMLDALHIIRVDLLDAADGATQLSDGLITAGTGADDLGRGAATLAGGTAALRDGSADLAHGVDSIAANLHTLSDGAEQVASGTAELREVADRVGAASDTVTSAVPGVRDDLAAALREQGLGDDRIAEVLHTLDPLGDRVAALDDRVQSAVSDIDRLDDGAAQVATGSAELAAGAGTAAAGAHDLARGAAQADDGAQRLSDGATTLASGIHRLEDGATALRDGLRDGAAELPDDDDGTRAAQAATLGDPVGVSEDALTQAQNYGAGLAPFFAALAGWIGIYALFLIVKPVSRRAVTALRSPVRVALAGWATPAVLGAVQMAALFGVLSVTLGFAFAHPLPTLGILLLASATFAAIILALNVWLGSVGQFVGLVLMVLQLVTAGGTFPWQTLPAPLAALHQVLPMGYVVDAMRQVMYGGDASRAWADAAVLAAWMLGALVLAILGVTRMTHRRTMRDLQPSLIG
ncbi:YhgE/Pip family protein [Microbacterium sp. EYE_5]|uniref:YhgE/Pip family protein n=1 Tax=unclassified Microbacterium TaxID=2609290 RepID=UPI002005535D|nr:MULTISPECIES: YhgE/Pip family protein [unclassified Microbacterium]MCK6079627.1 YhgE/Pip family protein [Microbacterium sp. EYE_382]MCK6084898.1 YhgE/Pip family protein [Microbacterium sp. EYE_384]MCK6122876.1 YhgE/Pip family protein [Microbacterium sp. EYE_80]MCK6125661.1 YhgE/Pip family protein [Microbacterium sp. EYE_79]MCK6140582.1 YhgE/Pip family protein [Microbacterium sp. EYE_39]